MRAPSSAAGILRELVAIATPSAMSNLPLLNWVTAYLKERGWSVQLFPYIDEAGAEKANLIAWPGNAKLAARVDLAFVCHTDTVPFRKEWAGALHLEERDGHFHGCGSCDVKGALACFLAAVDGIASGEIKPDVALILTADEEIGCKGMERLLPKIHLRIGSAIVSEPTSLRPGIAGKGYGLARITVQGREAHSAFPQQGVSAISIAARMIVAIEERFGSAQNQSGKDTLFDPPQTTINVGTIEGGSAKNILAGRCTFLVEWRAIPSEDPSRVLGLLREIAASAERSTDGAVVRVEALRAEPGFSPATRGALQMRLQELQTGEPMGISFGSEASRVARIADEVIVIGPGDMRTAHSDRECVPIDELERWTHALQELIRN